jgi:hypothetical protein
MEKVKWPKGYRHNYTLSFYVWSSSDEEEEASPKLIINALLTQVSLMVLDLMMDVRLEHTDVVPFSDLTPGQKAEAE